jgi:hypothetical protein
MTGPQPPLTYVHPLIDAFPTDLPQLAGMRSNRDGLEVV